KWDGYSFKKLSNPWNLFGTSQLFFMNDSLSWIASVGMEKTNVLLNKYISGSDAYVSVILPDRIDKIQFPDHFTYLYIVAIREIDSELYMLGTSNLGSKVYKLHSEDGQLILEVLDSLTANFKQDLRWLGLDGKGKAYAVHDSVGEIFSLDLRSSHTEKIGVCTAKDGPFQVFQSVLLQAESSVWGACGQRLLSLEASQMHEHVEAEARIVDATISSPSSERFSGLLQLADGRNQIFRKSISQIAEPFRIIRNEFIGKSKLAWETDQRLCQAASPRLGDNSALQIFCLEGDVWKDDQSTLMPRPLDVFETETYTWYVSRHQDGRVLVWRRTRNSTSTWTLVFEGQLDSLGAGLRFFPVAKPNEIGLMGSAHQLLILDAAGKVRELNQSNNIFGSFRPTLAGDGWLYGLTKGLGDQSDVFNLVSFDPQGGLHTLMKIPSNKIERQDLILMPLERGVLLTANTLSVVSMSPSYPWQVIYHDKIISLDSLYGEFKASTKRPVSLAAWSLPRGQVLIEKKMAIEGSDLQSGFLQSRFYFDGRKLTELETKTVPASNTMMSNSGDLPVPSLHFPQIWRGADMLWRRLARTERELPIVVGSEIKDLMDEYPLEPNQISAVGHFKGQMVFANAWSLWFCPVQVGVQIGAETEQINRVKGCELHPLRLQVRQLIEADDQRLYMLAGQVLYRYDFERRTVIPVLILCKGEIVGRALAKIG
ncbi:MAG: hypothetical protein NTX25_04005, partial [Proteobacteria bacterium]|nr:hypothetical protein [Pseudomonadota bacterium]